MARNPQKRAYGGGVKYLGSNSKATVHRAAGGKVCDMPGEKSAPRLDKRARGGGLGNVKSSAGGGSADKHPIFK